jgi:hypothetical protein
MVTAYPVTSLKLHQVAAEQLAALVRACWTIEAFRRICDFTHHEDHSQIRAGFGLAIRAVLHLLAVLDFTKGYKNP